MTWTEALAYIRLIPLVIVAWIVIPKARVLPTLIVFLWSMSIIFGTLMHNRAVSAVLLTPLVFMVSWYIIKTERER